MRSAPVKADTGPHTPHSGKTCRGPVGYLPEEEGKCRERYKREPPVRSWSDKKINLIAGKKSAWEGLESAKKMSMGNHAEVPRLGNLSINRVEILQDSIETCKIYYRITNPGNAAR